MGPPSYMLFVVDRNIVLRRMTVLIKAEMHKPGRRIIVKLCTVAPG